MGVLKAHQRQTVTTNNWVLDMYVRETVLYIPAKSLKARIIYHSVQKSQSKPDSMWPTATDTAYVNTDLLNIDLLLITWYPGHCYLYHVYMYT